MARLQLAGADPAQAMAFVPQVAFTLPAADPERVLGVALSCTGASGDFTDDEVALLNHARPFLIQAYRNAIAHS